MRRCYQNRFSFKIIDNWIYQGVIVVSSRDKSKGCLATFAERKSRFYIDLKMPNRSKDSMLSVVNQLIQSLPKEALKSFTPERGKEFDCYSDIEQQGIAFYFADAAIA